MNKIKWIDISIMIVGTLCIFFIPSPIQGQGAELAYRLIMIGIVGISLVDFMKLNKIKRIESYSPKVVKKNEQGVNEIVLLGEEGQSVMVWELTGRTALVIGKRNSECEVDIDLEESEYSALIDQQHAVLNYAANEWFIEDMYSKNGIRLQKQQDGICYKVAKNKPCKVEKGDIILIANTKLLLR